MKFEYLEPVRMEEALSSLAKYKSKARVLAGGTDLIVQMRKKAIRPEYLIDIGRIAGLDYVKYDREKLSIGARATISALEESPEIRRKHPIICQAASHLGSVAIRNVATIGGNLCNAAPSAEMAPALIALGATFQITGKSGERKVSAEEFFTGPGKTVLKLGELLTGIQVPLCPPRTGAAYRRHEIRKCLDLAIASVAAVITLKDGGVCQDARIVLGAVAPIPLRVHDAEDVLKNKVIDEALIQKCAEAAAGCCKPISDVRSSAEYRREMVNVYTKYVLRDALQIAKQG